jgi:hypothetical protein
LFFMKYNFGSVSVLCYRFTIFRFLFYSFYLLMTNDFFSNIRIGIINLVSDIYSSFDHNTRSNWHLWGILDTYMLIYIEIANSLTLNYAMPCRIVEMFPKMDWGNLTPINHYRNILTNLLLKNYYWYINDGKHKKKPNTKCQWRIFTGYLWSVPKLTTPRYSWNTAKD